MPDDVKGRALEFADFILSLIAPELEKARILNDKIGHVVASDIAVLVDKAEKWDRVKEIAELKNTRTCDDCPLGVCYEVLCVPAKSLVDALTEKEPT